MKTGSLETRLGLGSGTCHIAGEEGLGAGLSGRGKEYSGASRQSLSLGPKLNSLREYKKKIILAGRRKNVSLGQDIRGDGLNFFCFCFMYWNWFSLWVFFNLHHDINLLSQ